jgi:chitinase
MKRWLVVLVGTVTFALPASAADMWVTAYYAGWMQGNQWSFHLKATDIDYAAVTHIIHFSLVPNADGTLNSEANGITEENSAALISSAHAAGRKVLICVGGWNSDQGFAASTREGTRERFIMNLLAFVRTRKYDGIDIDWEPLPREYHKQYAAFLRELRLNMKTMDRDLLLTVACNSGAEVFAQVHPVLDQINVMTYDYAGAWPGWFTWHNAAIYDGVHAHIQEFMDAGVPREKLGIGIDFYGYVWNSGTGTPTGGVTAPRQTWNSAPWVKDNVPYYQIMESFYDAQAYRWDTLAQAAYLSIDKPTSADDKFVSYDDEFTCQHKISYVRERKLGGVIIWELGGGWQPKGEPRDRLLQAVKKAVTRR